MQHSTFWISTYIFLFWNDPGYFVLFCLLHKALDTTTDSFWKVEEKEKIFFLIILILYT